MNFLVSYLLIGNVIPLVLMVKIRQVYAKIESNHIGQNNGFGNKHNTNYHLIYNCQNIFIGITVLKIVLYLFLVLAFLIQIEDNDLKYLALLSALNLEPLLCDQKVLEDFESELPNALSQQELEEYQVCANESFIVGWLFIIPLTAFQIYTLIQFV